MSMSCLSTTPGAGSRAGLGARTRARALAWANLRPLTERDPSPRHPSPFPAAVLLVTELLSSLVPLYPSGASALSAELHDLVLSAVRRALI
jgi:hypothetical protein